MTLLAGEQNTGGEVRDADGRLIVVGPGGTPISGGTGGGGGGDPLSDGTPGGALPTRTLWVAGADGTVLRGLAVTPAGAARVNVENFPATQPVSGTVSVGNFPATQPVSLAANTPDVTDRAARLLGHVTVDNASVPVTGTFWQATQPVSGTVAVSNFPATQAVSGTVTSTTARAGTGTATSVAATVTANTTILVANVNRFGASIYNESTAVLFLLLGAGTESATVYTLQMAAGSYYETPFGFTGVIKGHWASANGSARVVEYT